jgi:GH25 family lysozyme M1 (1,4-beta-N-acetylmuramidase)
LVGIKATEYVNYTNPQHKEWVDEAHHSKLSILHYHFCRPEHNQPIQEAQHFWETVKPSFSAAHLDRLCIDIETGLLDTWPYYLRRFESELRSLTGEWAYNRLIGYTYLSAFWTLGGALKLGPGQWWVASLSNQAPPFDLPGGQHLWGWQHSFSEAFSGVQGLADGSYLNAWTTGELESALRPAKVRAASEL